MASSEVPNLLRGPGEHGSVKVKPTSRQINQQNLPPNKRIMKVWLSYSL